MFTDRTSIYNHRRPHLAVTTSAPPFSGADASRPRVRFYTVGTLCGSAQPESGQQQFTLCSFLARFLVAAVHRLHTPRSALMHTISLTHLALAVRVSSASSPTRTAQGVRDSGAHRLASCAKSRHCRSGLLSRLAAIALCPGYFDSLVPPLSQIRAPCNR